MQTVDYKKLMELGFPEHTSRDIIRQAKKLAVIEFEQRILELEKNKRNMIQYSCSPFDNPRVGIAPTHIVETLIGFSLS